jgi:predicted TIM-barrel fold metal-dependent hydrolase
MTSRPRMINSAARWGAGVSFLLLLVARLAGAADYSGPLIDAHSHVSNATVIDAYVAAMKRHNVSKVLLLGVGGVQKDDPAWIAAAARKYPDHVLVGLPLADPMADTSAARLDEELKTGRYRAVGEIHVRQVSRKIERNPEAPAFGRVLETVARHKVPLVIHLELTDQAAEALGAALSKHRTATLVLAHGGEGPPGRLETLLTGHSNLMVDLSGMHFQRTPALATETGPIDPQWKALIEKMPDRFVMGLDVWAARLFEPAMLDRLMKWTRRVLGELPPAVAEQVAYRNAARLYRIQ